MAHNPAFGKSVKIKRQPRHATVPSVVINELAEVAGDNILTDSPIEFGAARSRPFVEERISAPQTKRSTMRP
jgi:hypothetical protein